MSLASEDFPGAVVVVDLSRLKRVALAARVACPDRWDPRQLAVRLGFRLLPLSLASADETGLRTTALRVAYCAEAADAERDSSVLVGLARALVLRAYGACSAAQAAALAQEISPNVSES